MREKIIKTIMLTTLILSIIIEKVPVIAIPNVIEQIMSQVQNEVIDTLIKFFNVLLNIMRITYLVLGALGIFLWAAGIEHYRGKKMIIGAIVLAIAVEYLSRVKLVPS